MGFRECLETSGREGVFGCKKSGVDWMAKLTLEDLRAIALRDGEPKQISGQQELYEMIINQYI